MNKNALIYVAGHHGMVGRSIIRQLDMAGYQNLLTQVHTKLDLTIQQDVRYFFANHRPEYVFIAAAKVGGIHANSKYPADFIYDNLMIQANILEAAHRYNVKRLLFLGSSCIYPERAPQPMPETALLTSPLGSTNESYAIAKIAGIKMCESFNRQYGTQFRSVMPTNLYGEHDNFHLENSHVIPGLICKFHKAKMNNTNVTIWGTGKAKREFLHVDDMASACLHIMQMSEDEYNTITAPRLSHLNIGSGMEISIHELGLLLKKIINYQGAIVFDNSKPDGPPQKLLDITKITKSGWSPAVMLNQGLERTYQWFIENQAILRSS